MSLPLEQLVHIPVGQVHTEASLALPTAPVGVALFAHGSGSSRHSPRNNYVAGVLAHAWRGHFAAGFAHARGRPGLPQPLRYFPADAAAVRGNTLAGPVASAPSLCPWATLVPALEP